jgi:pSer/pThr/pTyr-binding forkhead associated (FHA) protein
MEVRLVLEGGKVRKRTIRLRSTETIIGRRQDCDLRLKSAEVSRRHCLLSVHDGYVSVEDLDSVNGTYLNGHRVVGKQVVRPGDSLEIGPLRFVVEYEITQAVLDRLNRHAAGHDELDVLPLAEADGAGPFAFDDQVLPAEPYEEKDTELASPRSPAAKDAASSTASQDEPLPVLEELEEGSDWHLPQNSDLRDILSGMDDPKSRKRPAKD